MNRRSALACLPLLAVFGINDRSRLASGQTAARPAAPATANTTRQLYNPPPATNAYPNAPAAPQALKPEEIEQVVAGIALYPDSLIAQILMASTYPLEVVQAER